MKALLDIKIDDPLRDNIIQCCILQSTHAAFHNTFGEYICIGNDLWIQFTQNLIHTTEYKSEKCNYHEYLSDFGFVSRRQKIFCISLTSQPYQFVIIMALALKDTLYLAVSS